MNAYIRAGAGNELAPKTFEPGLEPSSGAIELAKANSGRCGDDEDADDRGRRGER